MGSSKIAYGFASTAYQAVTADALIIGVFSETPAAAKAKSVKKTAAADKKAAAKTMAWTPALRVLDEVMKGQISRTAPEEKFDGAHGKVLLFRKSPSYGFQARRIVLIGLGERDKLSPLSWDKALQKAMGAVLGFENMAHFAITLPEETLKLDRAVAIKALVDAAAQATYCSLEALKKDKFALKKITLLASSAGAADKQALAIGQVLAEARSGAKDLVNQPANLKSTQSLVRVAKELGKQPGLTTTVQSATAWIQKNMPCFYAVAKGSLATDPPQWIQVRYRPASARAGKIKKRIALVGKSVVFDTGGYQVKTGNYMNTMKGDMTGGAVMLNVMRALAALRPEHLEVTAYLAATPNKIDSDAFLPDSIFPSASGKMIEIRHTDAEGRLTLIDAVALAAKDKPDALLTMATLTGSASQAVGMAIALMGNDETLVNHVHQAAVYHGEPVQMLTVTDDDYGNIKSKLDGADLINTSYGKGRGAQTAAAFVMSGAPASLPVAHMDIAGADMTPDEKATGIGQKTVIQYLLEENDRLRLQKPAAKATGGKSAAARVRLKKRRAR